MATYKDRNYIIKLSTNGYVEFKNLSSLYLTRTFVIADGGVSLRAARDDLSPWQMTFTNATSFQLTSSLLYESKRGRFLLLYFINDLKGL